MRNYLVRSATFMAVLIGAISNSVAGGGPFTRGCAARDMQILMMLEQQDSVKAIAAQELDEALTTMFDARMVCFAGRVLEALEIYDNLARRITSERIVSGRMN